MLTAGVSCYEAKEPILDPTEHPPDDERCAGELALCGEDCVDLDLSREHCGRCNRTCEAGEICSEGRCVPGPCEGGETRCDGTCVDTSRHSDHCGDCDRPCRNDHSCIDGECVPDCDGKICDGKCVDVESDDEHCGDCSVACSDGRICLGGQCALVCGNETTACEGTCCEGFCVDVDTDPEHCGECKLSCLDRVNSRGGTCVAGLCILDCEAGTADCDGDPTNGCEMETVEELEHCGECENHCGAKSAVDETACYASMCHVLTCQDGFGDCDGLGENGCEVDFASDPSHCGACDASCYDLPNSLALPLCSAGTCAIECAEGFEDCDGNERNGCEAELAIDRLNCGGCGTVCPYNCVDGECDPVVSVAAGNNSACAVLSSGEVWCWGGNRGGEVPGGSEEGVSEPTRVEGIPPMARVKIGDRLVCALSTTGELWCWGSGYLGNGLGHQGRQPPSKVQNLDEVIEYSVGSSWACVVTRARELWCWGTGQNGKLGVGTTTDHFSPVQADLQNVEKVALTVSSACAITEEGDVYCWGSNSFGQLGQNDTTARHSPTLVEGVGDVVHIDGGNSQFVAVTRSGEAWGWGLNGSGRLGDGTTTSRRVPTKVKNPSEVVTIDTGSGHTCALTESGEVWCWGSNTNGQLGLGFHDGTNTTPAKVDVPKAVSIWTGLHHSSFAITEDGVLWAWGQNANGQLGEVNEDTDPNTAVPFAPAIQFVE